MTTPRQTAAPGVSGAPGAQGTVRRVIVFLLLFVLVCLTASGLAGLLGRLFEVRPEFDIGIGGLALSLAFTLVGGPLAAVLWWFAWRRLDGPDRGSVAWGLYLTAISFTALVVFTSALLGMFADLIAGRWDPTALGTAIAWLAVWGAHRWMRLRRRPVRLRTAPGVLGAAYGLIVGVVGVVRALASLFDEAIAPAQAHLGGGWWVFALQSLVWGVGGALIWWWHWYRDGVRSLRGGFADVALVVVGVLGAAATTLGGVIAVLYVGLRALFDPSEPWREIVEPLGLGVAAAAVAAAVWLYHRRIALARTETTAGAIGLVEAGLGLIAAASGIGVVINALLAALTEPLAGSDARALLLGGIAALVAGAPLWWIAWRPPAGRVDAAWSSRRVYLIAVFGVSAVVAIVALLVVGYRLFSFALEGDGGNLVEQIRAPFGLLVATALIAGYHFAIWRRDRVDAEDESSVPRIRQVILVAPPGANELARTIGAVTGAAVTRWVRADAAGDAGGVRAGVVSDVDAAGSGRADAGGVGAAGGVDAAALTDTLAGLTARRVLVLAAPDGRVEVVPLAD